MSRSDYTDDGDEWALIRWRGAVNSAIRGKRGQAFLRELLDSMDAMESKRLIADELETSGEFCALGVVGNARGIDMTSIDPDDSWQVSREFGIAEALAREIVYMNDEAFYQETPEQRFSRMRKWVAAQIHNEQAEVQS